MRLTRLFQRLRSALTIWPAYESGHFYSPVVDPSEVARRRELLWPTLVPDCIGIDLNDAAIRATLREDFPRYLADFDYPEQPDPSNPTRYFIRNSEFSWLDARALFVLLRTLQPRRMIEVGSGFSSLLSADINQRFLNGAMDFCCIEPFPRPFLRAGVPGISRVIVEPVQSVDPRFFDTLGDGDVLFIDSSHVSKTGSDVNHLYLSVLPRLRPGVVVHIHDIFLPDDYPREWVVEKRRSWNEQYLVQIMLQHSKRYSVLFASHYAHRHHPELVAKALGRSVGFGGSSLWLRVQA